MVGKNKHLQDPFPLCQGKACWGKHRWSFLCMPSAVSQPPWFSYSIIFRNVDYERQHQTEMFTKEGILLSPIL